MPVVAQSSSTTAQSSTAASTPVTGESIQDRKENQQDRIANGVKSGQLTAGENANLEKKQAVLNQEERNMRKLDNGKLTAADKKTLTQQQKVIQADRPGQAQYPAPISWANTTRQRAARPSRRREKPAPPGSHRRRFLFAWLLSFVTSGVTPRKYGKSSA